MKLENASYSHFAYFFILKSSHLLEKGHFSMTMPIFVTQTQAIALPIIQNHNSGCHLMTFRLQELLEPSPCFQQGVNFINILRVCCFTLDTFWILQKYKGTFIPKTRI